MKLQTKDLYVSEVGKREFSDNRRKSEERQQIILRVIWTERNEEIATKERLINIKANEIFFRKKWIQEMEIETRRDLCEEIVRLTDRTKKVL